MRSELAIAFLAVAGPACVTPVVGFVPLADERFAPTRAVEQPPDADFGPIGWVFSSEKNGAPDEVKRRAVEHAGQGGGERVVLTQVSGFQTESSSFSGSSSLGMMSSTTPLTLYSGSVTDSREVPVIRWIGKVYRRGAPPSPPARDRPFLTGLAKARLACPRGEPEGCGGFGSALGWDRTRGLSAEDKLAQNERDCAAGHPSACEAAGWEYARGVGTVPVDLAKSEQLRRRGCALGSASACSALGDHARARVLNQAWCAAGQLDACEVQWTFESRMERHRELCGAGRPEHCYWAAVSLRLVPGQADAATALFRQACEDGDGRACGELAALSEGVVALRLAAEACELGECARLEALLSK